MKTNVSTLILCISLFFIATISSAQQRQVGTPEERANWQTIRMKEALNLSPDQEKSVSEINLKYAQQAQPLLENGGRNLKTLREARSIMKNKNKDMKDVLTSDQFKQYQAIREEMRNTFRERRRQNNA
ncbi:hypothetical protein GCM10027592_46290 [Spirosoma flavus]